MNMKKALSAVMATALVASMASVASLAAFGDITNGDGDRITAIDSGAAKITGENVQPDTTFYFSLGAHTTNDIAGGFNASRAGMKVSAQDLTDSKVFKFSVDKDTNAKLIKSVEIVTEKILGKNARQDYIKVVLADTTTTDELKINGTFEFKAKVNYDSAKHKTVGGNFTSGDTLKMDYTLWLNTNKTNDSANAGDRVVFESTKNDENSMTWGDDLAALWFNANDDAGKFYARLSTKVPSDLYVEYGDPVGADLWVYDFVTNPTVPSTSKATLTLGIPWDQDKDIVPNPEDCFIYEMDADGNLTDVTSQFTYSEDNDDTTGIAGWTTKTRTLGTYVLSDTELDVAMDETDDEPASSEGTTAPDKTIPNTGSSDMVNVAVVAAVVSLAAAGAVAFRKVK